MNKPIPTTRTRRVKPISSSRAFSYPFPFLYVYQFKVTLRYTVPAVWRRIQVPWCYTFWDLHCAITDAFGWLNQHHHRFTLVNPKTGARAYFGVPEYQGGENWLGTTMLPVWKANISLYLTPDNMEADYIYDFGDDWHHSVVLEEILPNTGGTSYPRCIAGENACPPEDCGGYSGYQRFKKAIANPHATDHHEMLNRVGGWFDPEWFDVGLVRFEDPRLRWEVTFLNKPCPKTMRTVQYHRMKNGRGV